MKHTSTKIIGITGGIATGKSAVSSILREKGYRVIDADIIARQVVEKNQPALKELVAHFGQAILDDYGNLNRQALGDLVFSNPQFLEDLNRITHPYIFDRLKKTIEKDCLHYDFVFVDVPLLFEVYDELEEWDIRFYEIWLVYLDQDRQLERLIKRNKLSRSQALARINTQIPMDEKKKLATRIIDNRGDLTDLRNNVEEILSEFIH